MPEADNQQLMSFSDHLGELRTRLKYALYSLLVGVGIAYLFSDFLFVLLAQPLVEAWSAAGLGPPKIHFANPIEPFFTYIKISIIGGVFIAAPGIFYQLWKFIAPGLYKNEKKYVIPFSLISAAFFIGGAAFGYFIVFPYGFRFFLSFAKSNMGSMQKLFGQQVELGVKTKTFELKPTLMMGEYFGLVWRLLLAFGVIFELPLLLVFFSMVGLVTHRGLWKWNPYFAVLSFVIAAVLTPPDVITQLFMAGPLIVLYNISIIFAWFFTRRNERRRARLLSGDVEQKDEGKGEGGEG
jgi:sec-independent protein translocase protein TatC